MKKYIYIVFTITIFMFSISKTNAAYDKEREKYLDQIEEANEVKFNYYLNEEYYDETSNKVEGIFKLEISNIKPYMEIRIYELDINITQEDIQEEKITLDNITSGIKKIGIYNKQYNYLLKTVRLNIPKYNYYSLKEECKDKKDLDVCDKWYPYELNDSTFYYKIKKYQEKEPIIEENKTNIFDTFINFTSKYYIYIILFILLIVVLSILIIMRKKRYSLD